MTPHADLESMIDWVRHPFERSIGEANSNPKPKNARLLAFLQRSLISRRFQRLKMGVEHLPASLEAVHAEE